MIKSHNQSSQTALLSSTKQTFSFFFFYFTYTVGEFKAYFLQYPAKILATKQTIFFANQLVHLQLLEIQMLKNNKNIAKLKP